MGRALAHARGWPRGFDDPFALELLPDEVREAARRGIERRWPRDPREVMLRAIAFTTSRMMGPRTLAIDDALLGLPAGAQVVLLGAGLDARAHRLHSLREATVFELDHPATQAWKRARAEGLPVRARSLVYVPIDFERDSLEGALERAGHCAELHTVWVWEGVITYLRREGIAATLSVLERRSAPGSRLVLTYNE